MTTAHVEQIYPLSPTQQGMLYETLAATEVGIHVEQIVWKQQGALNEEALERAWQHVVDRHQILRTCFVHRHSTEPVQVVLDRVRVPLGREDLRALPEAEQELRADEILQAERLRGFKPASPPLMRLVLLRLTDDRVRLIWTFHHLLLDGWSLPLLLREVALSQRAFAEGRQPDLPHVRPWSDHLAWLARADRDAARRFFAQMLDGVPGPTPLGHLAPPRDDVVAHRHGVTTHCLDEASSQQTQAFARRQHVTAGTIIEAAWAMLLGRYAETTDVVFGVTSSGRPADLPGVETIIGPFIGTLPTRLVIDPDASLAPWLQEIQTRAVDRQAFAFCSPGEVQRWSGVPAALPLYDSLLVYENYPMTAAAAAGIAPADLVSIGARTRHALVVIVIPGPRLELRVVYDERRFDSDTAIRLAAQLGMVIRAVVDGARTARDAMAALEAEPIPDVHALAAPARGRSVDRSEVHEPTPPRRPTELRLAAIWTGTLGLPLVGVDQNFFELGGHSLLAAELVTEVRRAFGIVLPIVSVFESPTIAALAERIEVARRDQAPAGGTSGLASTTIVPAPMDRYEPFPLTDIQQAYWVGRSGDYELGRVATHLYFEIDGHGLDHLRLERAFQQLIDRHDMLRAIVLPDGRQQVIEHVPAYRIETLDLRGRDRASVETRCAEIRAQMSHQVLPADRWPLFQLRTTRLSERTMRLHVSLDALIADAWSVFCLFREWASLYRDPNAVLPPLELTFRDYVLAEDRLRHGEEYERSKRYWLSRIDDLPAAPELPLAVSPETITHGRFRRRSGRLAPEAWMRLKRRAGESGLTPSVVLLTAFGDLLATWARNRRFTLSLTLFHRVPLHPQVNDLVGDFTSLTLLEADHTAREPFVSRALRLQGQLWQDLDHRYFSGVRVLRELARRRGASQKAVMPVVFTSTLSLGPVGTEASVLDQFGEMGYVIGQTPQVWLDLQVLEHGGALVFNLDAVEELFSAGVLDDLFAAWRDSLEDLTEREAAWHELDRSLVPAAHLALQRAANATAMPIDDERLHDGFLARAARQPDAPAVLAPDRELTYGELSRLASRLARRLRDAGARPNTLVAVVMEKGWEQVAAVLGTLRSGAAYLPVGASLPFERRRQLLEQGGVQIVLTQPPLVDALRWPDGIRCMTVSVDLLTDPEPDPVDAVTTPSDLAYVIFTSGSTGRPKGVAIEHRGAVNTIRDINGRFAVGPRDRVLALSELGFDLSVYDIFGVLAAGGAIVMPSSVDARDPAHWVAAMRRHRVTLWNSVPALATMLVDYLSVRADQRPADLRLVLLSGDWIPVKLPDELRAIGWDTSLRVISLGGATEASIWSIIHPIDAVDPTWKSIPYGVPLANQRFFVLDDALDPVPVWAPGQLHIGGVGLARGYFGDPERTAASFITHPKTGERLYRTGDLGRRWPDGRIEFLGRVDSQVKINGYRIELGEIEAALNEHEGVKEAVVTVGGAAPGSRQLVAWVVADERAEPSLYETVAGDLAATDRRFASVAEAGRAEAARARANGPDRAALSTLWQSLDDLYLHALRRALRELGLLRAVGERYDVDELLARCRIVPRYRRWLERALGVLVDEGQLRQEGQAYRVVSIEPDGGGEALVARVRGELVRGVGFTDAECAWFLDGVEHLVQVLTDSHRTAWTYAAGETPLVYQRLFRECNLLVREAVRAAALTPETLRVLEVGAGWGSVTEHLLPVFDPARTRFTFTDISSFFFKEAEARFATHAFVDYAILDLDQDPQAQGFEPHSVDVVIAASVFHATRSIRQSLAHVRTLLAPGGLLLIVEETRFLRAFDLGMGLQQGFDRFEDDDLRRSHPLLSRERWQGVLDEAGFEGCVPLSRPDATADVVGFEVFVARAPISARRFDPKPLRVFLEAKLPGHMVPSVYVPLDRLPLSRNGKVDRDALPRLATAQAGPSTSAAAPRTPTETALAALWSDILRVRVADVHSNFFEIGGDSLLATQLSARVRQDHDVELPLARLYERPTVAGLAAFVESVRGTHGVTLAAASDRVMAAVGDEREEGEL